MDALEHIVEKMQAKEAVNSSFFKENKNENTSFLLFFASLIILLKTNIIKLAFEYSSA